MTDNDGGPAFPFTWQEPNALSGELETVAHPGMSTRDWFAGQALMGLCNEPMEAMDFDAQNIGTAAYLIADAMIQALEVKDE